MDYGTQAGAFGCFVQIVLLILLAFLGDWLMGYNLETWFGYMQWDEVNIFLRLLIGLLTVKFVVILGIIAFITGLIVGVPIFPV